MSDAAKRARRKLRSVEFRANAMALTAAESFDKLGKELEATRARNDFWRNLMVASCFARGMGNEKPMSEVIAEYAPGLL